MILYGALLYLNPERFNNPLQKRFLQGIVLCVPLYPQKTDSQEKG